MRSTKRGFLGLLHDSLSPAAFGRWQRGGATGGSPGALAVRVRGIRREYRRRTQSAKREFRREPHRESTAGSVAGRRAAGRPRACQEPPVAAPGGPPDQRSRRRAPRARGAVASTRRADVASIGLVRRRRARSASMPEVARPSAARAACASGRRRRRPLERLVRRGSRATAAQRLEGRPAVVLDPGSRRPGRRARSRRRAPPPPPSSGRPPALPPVTTRQRRHARSVQSATAWSRRASKTGDGRPSYWAAPRTTIASAGLRALVRVALLPDPEGRVARDGEAAPARPATTTAANMPARAEAAPGVAQRPWHFLYFGPEPHQHGSLRPTSRRRPGALWPGAHRPVAAPAAASPAMARPRREPAARRSRPGLVPGDRPPSSRCRRGRRPGAARGARPARPSPRRPPRGWRRAAPASASARRLRVTRDPEDRGRDLVADEAAQLLVEAERLLLELVERVLLGVAAEADAAPHVVELGEVLDPQRVDRPEQDEPLDHRPVGLADLGLAWPRAVASASVAEVLGERLAAAGLPELVVRARPGPVEAHRRGAPSTRASMPQSSGCSPAQVLVERGRRAPRRGRPGPSRSGPRCGGPCRARRRSSRAAC